MKVALSDGEVCDPPDLWEGNTQLIDGNDGNTYFYSTYQSWAEAPIHSTYSIRGLAINGDLALDGEPMQIWTQDDVMPDGACLWYNCGDGLNWEQVGFHDFHINNDGVGYRGFTSFSGNSDNAPPHLKTLFYEQTENFGQTWGGYGYEGESRSYSYISDQTLLNLSDSLLSMWTDSEVLSQELPTYDDEIFMEDESSPYFYTPGFLPWR